MRVTSHQGEFISPGDHVMEVQGVETHETWYMGHLIDSREETTRETHVVRVPDPGLDGPPEDESSWALRGEFTFMDRRWTVVRDDDMDFWGTRPGGVIRDRAMYLEDLDTWNRESMVHGQALGWWRLDDLGMPQRPPLVISRAEMMARNKTLMAHLLVDLGVFKSVGEAKRNGWDRPLELGLHDLGPRRKRVTVEITS